MRTLDRPTAITSLALLLFSVSCTGGEPGDGSPTGPNGVDRIRVTPTALTLEVTVRAHLDVQIFDRSGELLEPRPVAWLSSTPSVASVDSTGLVTALSPGTTTITATTERRSDAAVVSVTPLQRSSVDRPDDRRGHQIHVLYVVPADGTDRRLDQTGVLANSVGSFHHWFRSNSGGLGLKFDTYRGEVDITFHRLSRTNEEMAANGAFVVSEIEEELASAGRLEPDKIYLVYYDGLSTWACGGAPWPPLIPGQVAAMYLKGEPPVGSCGGNRFAASRTAPPGYWEFAMLHDLIHALGIVDLDAPNHASRNAGHVPEPTDLMYSGSDPWALSAITIDVGRDDYFGEHVDPGLARLEASPWVERVRTRSAPAERAAPIEVFRTALPPHPPFGALRR